jgi:hypothetical protein
MRSTATRMWIKIFGIKNVVNAQKSPKIEAAYFKKAVPPNNDRAKNFGFMARFYSEDCLTR